MVKKKLSGSHTVKHGSLAGRSFTTRNLQPQDLGAVLFGCTNNTFAECHRKQLFGLPRAHLSYVQNIKEGLPLFLFNYDDRTLHGIYEAASNGMFCPQSNAWSRKGKEKTDYPAQVAMRLKFRCIPLAENQFRNAILTNYYERMPGVFGQMRFFHFELDHEQTRALMNMFIPLPSPYNLRTPTVAESVHEHVQKSSLQPVLTPELEGNYDVNSEKAVKLYADSQKKDGKCDANSKNAVKPYTDTQKEELEGTGYVGVNVEHFITNNECSSGFNDLDCGDKPLEGRDHVLSNKDAKLQQQQSCQDDKRLSLELEKLKMLCPQQHNSEFYANATATADIDTYSCKDAQGVKSTVLDGSPDPDETFNANINRLSLGYYNPPVESLDFKICAEAKMMNTRCIDENQLSPSLPAITQQFQETETKRVQAVYKTPNNINGSGALEATDPAGHPQSSCIESTSIQLVTISSSQECMRVENSSTEKRKRKTPDCHDEIHNKHQNGLPSPDYISSYVKDRLIGNITCMVCGEQGHYTCHCRMKDQEGKVVCTVCNKVGHCHLWCCREHVSENRACRRCGEKGHYTSKDLSHCDEKYPRMYIRCSSCDDSHPRGRCPMGKVTCFLCEGKDHVPAHCRLSPMLTVTQEYRQSFQSVLKEALAETNRGADTPLEQHDVTYSKFRTKKKKTANVICFCCHEKGHYSHNCPVIVNTVDKTPGGLELHDVTCNNFDVNGKKPPGALLCDVTCFKCHDKGHYSYNCPKNEPRGQCHGAGHCAKLCSKKKQKKKQQK